MASPQKENGYTAIANELLDALCRTRINGEARQVLDVIIRKTYGFQKKEDAISLSQFCEKTLLKKPTVCKAIKKLSSMNLITQKDNATAKVYRFNKDFDTWRSLPKKITITQKDNGHYPKSQKSLPKKSTTKEKKETITKETVANATFSFEEEFKKLREGTRKDFKLIAYYWSRKGWKFENQEQFNSALKRELKPAKTLLGYSGKEVKTTIDHCIEKYPEWTLETVFKRIQDLVNKND